MKQFLMALLFTLSSVAMAEVKVTSKPFHPIKCSKNFVKRNVVWAKVVGTELTDETLQVSVRFTYGSCNKRLTSNLQMQKNTAETFAVTKRYGFLAKWQRVDQFLSVDAVELADDRKSLTATLTFDLASVFEKKNKMSFRVSLQPRKTLFRNGRSFPFDLTLSKDENGNIELAL